MFLGWLAYKVCGGRPSSNPNFTRKCSLSCEKERVYACVFCVSMYKGTGPPTQGCKVVNYHVSDPHQDMC